MISGRGSNMKAILENVRSGILQDICKVVTVFSNNRKAPGLKTAEEFKIKTQVIESRGKKRSEYNGYLLQLLSDIDPDYIVLAGYMKILPVEIVSRFPGRIINIHPADTALHQGLHGYEWAFEQNLKTTKITVHFVDEGLDTGKVIAKHEIDLTGAETLDEVETRGLKVEHEFYSQCLQKIFSST